MEMTEGALVLEGGSLRSMFTAGVLDVFLEKGICLSYVNGVSAGSLCGLNYVSGQIGRTHKVTMDYVHDKRYLSFRNMVKNRSIFNFDFLFGEISTDLVPFDSDAFFNSPQRYTAVATRCKTGRPEFFEKGKCDDILKAVQASSSMPVLSRMVTVEGRKYLDGGISMPIAYDKAMEEGYKKVLLVLTREQGYRKKPIDSWTKRAYRRYFSPLPRLLDSLMEVPDRYNRMQEEIDEMEESGKIFVIRPKAPVTVSRVEHDKKKLEALYLEGQLVAEEKLDDLKKYLAQ